MKRMMKKIVFRYGIVLSAICTILPLVSLLFNEWRDEMGKQLFFLAVLSLFCALGEFIIMESEERQYSKKEIIIRFFFHYLYMNLVVLFFGIKIGWFTILNRLEIGIVLVMIAIIYLINVIASYARDKSLAEKMNQKLLHLENQQEMK